MSPSQTQSTQPRSTRPEAACAPALLAKAQAHVERVVLQELKKQNERAIAAKAARASQSLLTKIDMAPADRLSPAKKRQLKAAVDTAQRLLKPPVKTFPGETKALVDAARQHRGALDAPAPPARSPLKPSATDWNGGRFRGSAPLGPSPLGPRQASVGGSQPGWNSSTRQ
jgi:hypothetical protein